MNKYIMLKDKIVPFERMERKAYPCFATSNRHSVCLNGDIIFTSDSEDAERESQFVYKKLQELIFESTDAIVDLRDFIEDISHIVVPLNVRKPPKVYDVDRVYAVTIYRGDLIRFEPITTVYKNRESAVAEANKLREKYKRLGWIVTDSESKDGSFSVVSGFTKTPDCINIRCLSVIE